VADNETTTVDDDTDQDEETAVEPAAGSGYAFDEQTLGRSSSVFDAGVEFVPSAVPPAAPPVGGYIDSAYADGGYEPAAEPQREMSYAERRRRVRLEARRVRRVVRHIELWSVLKVSLIFYLCLWLIMMLAGLVLWSFAAESGTLDSIEELVESLFALEEGNDFWSGDKVLGVYSIITLVFCIAGITFTVLLAGLYNLISDLTGGVRLTVIEEESARFVPPKRRTRR